VGVLANDRILIFDTTLRDGEQGRGFSLHVDEKLALAHALDALGVDIMEPGFPIASPKDAEPTGEEVQVVLKVLSRG
jgi:2-isopropylmalate synthase